MHLLDEANIEYKDQPSLLPARRPRSAWYYFQKLRGYCGDSKSTPPIVREEYELVRQVSEEEFMKLVDHYNIIYMSGKEINWPEEISKGLI